MKPDQIKFLLTFAATFGTIALAQHLVHFSTPPLPARAEVQEGRTANPATQAVSLPPAEDFEEQTDMLEQSEHQGYDNTDTVRANDIANENIETDTAAPTDANLRSGSRMWSYRDCFPDLQEDQLKAAIRNGIKPLSERSEIQRLTQQHKLIDISSSPFYALDDLTHSLPYLVPKAQHLLNTISINFIDSLQRKGLPPHLIVVSSVLRTDEDVSRLQYGNRNATTNSCHRYGTTIDIAYHRFMPITGEYPSDGSEPVLTRWDDKLKFVLAEVLNDLRLKGRCYVKYEQRQACFHLTVR
jgi:hypothetical protein